MRSALRGRLAIATSYKQAGVDIDKGNAFVDAIKPATKRTDRPGVMGAIGGFGGLFDLAAAGYDNPLLVAATDGVGTKLRLGLSTGRLSGLGIDLVAMCVNDLIVQGAEPLFFLDYYATGNLDLDAATAVVDGIAEGCVQAGCALIGGETAEMPGMYGQDEYDLAGFTVGVVDRPQLIDGSRINTGHIVLGLSSSGPHSNGYSLIRKVLEQSGDDPSMPLGDTTLGSALLAPTRIYVNALLPLIEKHRIDGMAHITGGGISENIVRVIPDHLGLEIDLSAWQVPAVFQWLQTRGRIDEQEMLRTFNCGIGMVILVAEDSADEICGALTAANEPVCRLGKVVGLADNQPRVRYFRS